MLTLWTRRLWPYLAALLVATCAVATLSRRETSSAPHQATIYAEHYVHVTDTLYRHDTVAYKAAAGSYRAIRDTLRLTDTVAVGIALERADSAVSKADAMLAASRETIKARDTLVVRVREELQPSRLTTRAIALYDPIAQVPSAALESSVRLIGRVSAIARVDQRFAVGEHPRAAVGLALTF